MWLFSSTIFILSIYFIRAVPLDGTCNETLTCDPNTECRNNRCVCKSPWFTPCNATCVAVRRVSYEGERCEVEQNCVPNTRCDQNKCVCLDQFTAREGLCYKRLNDSCTADNECWSAFCNNGRCACRDGSSPGDDAYGCVPRLVKVYSSLNAAVQANQLCSSSLNCITSLANCVSEGNSTRKFCKCPEGYNVASNNENCEPIVNSLLSPLTTRPSSYGQCGACQASDAFCTKAADERTCWCRTGFEKVGEQCVRITRFRPLLLFPNSLDIGTHDFASNCDNVADASRTNVNGICNCAPGYRFQARDSACVPIEVGTRRDVIEYGVCTRVVSDGAANGFQGLCPKPTNCVAARDKHICSCGVDQFVDVVNNNTVCTYFVGTNSSRTNGSCAPNSQRNSTNGICTCSPGYAPSTNNQRCDLILSAQIFNSSCTQDRTNDNLCTSRFGNKARFCSAGECRCTGEQSFLVPSLNGCYAPLNTSLSGTLERCPPNSDSINRRCVCRAGFRSSNDGQLCVRLSATLLEYQGMPNSSNAGDWTLNDCRAFYTGPVELYAAGQCQCRNIANINDNRDGCWYQLNRTLPDRQEATFCPPQSGAIVQPTCSCLLGYRPNNNRCIPLADRLYDRNEANPPNIDGVNNNTCITAFGVGSEKSPQGNFCVCKEEAFPVRNYQYCHFFINRTTQNLKGNSECPLRSRVNITNNNRVCVCDAGYTPSSDYRSCVFSNVNLVGTLARPSANNANCTIYSDIHCTTKFGTETFCKDDQCFCDRRLSYLTNGRCESYANYIFPGEHELSDHTCNTDQDCGKQNVICASRAGSSYKVCQCQSGSYLNPRTQSCENQRCAPACDSARNFECAGYECVCKQGFLLVNGRCQQIGAQLAIYQTCNTSVTYAPNNGSLYCDRTCQRALCPDNKRVEDNQCVDFGLEDDRCIFREQICTSADKNSVCSLLENQCVCGASFYRYKDECAKAVNSICSSATECGGEMECNQNRCVCNPNQHQDTTTDYLGRTIEYCRSYGIPQVQINLVLLFFITFCLHYFI